MCEDLIKSMPLTMSDIVLLARNGRHPALEILMKSAQYGDGVEQSELAQMYLDELVDPENSQSENIKQTLYWLELAAIKANLYSCNAVNLIQKLSLNCYDKDNNQALDCLVRVAESGFSYAQYKVGWMYCKGNCFEKDEKKGIEWLTKSADQGNAYAQHSLAFKYRVGQGVDENNDEALRLFKLAAEQDYDDSQYELAYMFENGYGVDKDTEIAIKWYAQAAENGHKEAMEKIKEFASSGYKSAVEALDQIDFDEDDKND
jgi:TPR repeat protein